MRAIDIRPVIAPSRSKGNDASNGSRADLSEYTLRTPSVGTLLEYQQMKADNQASGGIFCLDAPMIHTGSGLELEEETPKSSLNRLPVGMSPFRGENFNVKLAVLDSGINLEHAAFRGVHLAPGDRRSFVHSSEDDTDVTDRLGHGTYCAALAVGRDVLNQRIGVAPELRNLIVAKVIDEDNRMATSLDICDALRWAVSRGADVVSLSFGIDFSRLMDRLVETFDLPVNLALKVAYAEMRDIENLFHHASSPAEPVGRSVKGALIFAASGNDSLLMADQLSKKAFSIPSDIPARIDGFNAVGSVPFYSSDTKSVPLSKFSNTPCDFATVGERLVGASILGNDTLEDRSGTSGACAVMAGVAALWWEYCRRRNAAVTADEVLSRMKNSAFASPDVDCSISGKRQILALPPRTGDE